MYKITISSW